MSTMTITEQCQPQPDPLLNFAQRFLGQPVPVPLSVFAGVSFVGDFAQLVLAREGQFQAQLCLCKPGAEIPDHGHPHVDQLLIYVTGEVFLRINGKPIYNPGHIHELATGLCSQNSHCMRIGPGVSHGATIGPAGGAFVTLQHWTSGKPSSVEHDWQGPALSAAHARSLSA